MSYLGSGNLWNPVFTGQAPLVEAYTQLGLKNTTSGVYPFYATNVGSGSFYCSLPTQLTNVTNLTLAGPSTNLSVPGTFYVGGTTSLIGNTTFTGDAIFNGHCYASGGKIAITGSIETSGNIDGDLYVAAGTYLQVDKSAGTSSIIMGDGAGNFNFLINSTGGSRSALNCASINTDGTKACYFQAGSAWEVQPVAQFDAGLKLQFPSNATGSNTFLFNPGYNASGAVGTYPYFKTTPCMVLSSGIGSLYHAGYPSYGALVLDYWTGSADSSILLSGNSSKGLSLMPSNGSQASYLNPDGAGNMLVGGIFQSSGFINLASINTNDIGAVGSAFKVANSSAAYSIYCGGTAASNSFINNRFVIDADSHNTQVVLTYAPLGNTPTQNALSSIVLQSDGSTALAISNDIKPITNSTSGSTGYVLGDATHQWRTIYCYSTPVISDSRLKYNVAPITVDPLVLIKQLQVKQFNMFQGKALACPTNCALYQSAGWCTCVKAKQTIADFTVQDPNSILNFGLIAQDVKALLHSYNLDATMFIHYDADADMYAIDYSKFIPFILQAIQELAAKINA